MAREVFEKVEREIVNTHFQNTHSNTTSVEKRASLKVKMCEAHKSSSDPVPAPVPVFRQTTPSIVRPPLPMPTPMPEPTPVGTPTNSVHYDILKLISRKKNSDAEETIQHQLHYLAWQQWGSESLFSFRTHQCFGQHQPSVLVPPKQKSMFMLVTSDDVVYSLRHMIRKTDGRSFLMVFKSDKHSQHCTSCISTFLSDTFKLQANPLRDRNNEDSKTTEKGNVEKEISKDDEFAGTSDTVVNFDTADQVVDKRDERTSVNERYSFKAGDMVWLPEGTTIVLFGAGRGR
jgi:hypothetical protein